MDSIRLRCEGIAVGVTEVTFLAELRLQELPGGFELHEKPASPAGACEQWSLVHRSNVPYTLARAVDAIKAHCDPLGRDFRSCTEVDGTDGFEADVLKMAWMGNAWDLEDAEEQGDNRPIQYALQDLAWLITRLTDGDARRAYDEISRVDAAEPRLVEIMTILEDLDATNNQVHVAQLGAEEFSPEESILDQLLRRVRRAATEHAKQVELSQKGWKHFPIKSSGRSRATFSTNGSDCTYTIFGPGGGRTEKDTENAIRQASTSADETLLRALCNEGFEDLADVLRRYAGE